MDSKWALFESDGRVGLVRFWEAVIQTPISFLVFLLISGAFLKLVDVVYLAVFKAPLSLPFDTSLGNAVLLYVGCYLESLVAITMKRLHDRNKSGWWIVPFFVGPFLLHRSSHWLGNATLALLVDIIGVGLGGWCFIDLLCLSGTSGANRFGPHPLAPARRRWVRHRAPEFVPLSAGPPPAWLVRPGHE